MNTKTLSLALLPLAAFFSQLAHAAPAGQITQLEGFVTSARAGSALKALAVQSVIEPGDTLLSEPGAYVRVALPDGAQAILGPNTRVRMHASSIELLSGQLRFVGGVMASPEPFSISAGGSTVQTGNASFELFLVPDPKASLAQQAYARAAMAALSGPVTDADAEMPVWIAQVNIPLPSGSPPRPPGSPPGLYVVVIDGLINVSNRGGTQNFTAGQFGFTPNPMQAPAPLPTNPGLRFTLPAAFNTPNPNSSASGTAPKPGAVDCEVR